VRVSATRSGDLLRAGPALQLLLARDCEVHVVEGCPVEESLDIVAAGETFHLMELVLEDALVQVAGETDVQGCLRGCP
jgi:hypothetical protein